MEVSLRGAEQIFLKIMKRIDGIRDEESKEVKGRMNAIGKKKRTKINDS